MRPLTVANLLITMCIMSIFLASHLTEVSADVYQWTDPDGTVHFSDTPSNVPKGTTAVTRQEEPDSIPVTGNTVYGKKMGVKAGKQMRAVKKVSSIENKEEDAVQDSNNTESKKEPEKDPASEAEIREVWRMHNNALARNDAVSAASYIASDEREGCLETFIAFGNKLNLLNDGNDELDIDYIRDGHARAVVIREEEVSGRKERVGYPVHFYKVNGVWKLDKC